MFRNDRHGLSAKKFYGLIHLMDSRITDNDGHGIILTTEKTNLEALNQVINAESDVFNNIASMSSGH
jgi:hypothetical protein